MFLLQRSFIDCLTCQAAEGKWSLQTSQLVFQLNTQIHMQQKYVHKYKIHEHFCNNFGALREVHIQTQVNVAFLK